MSTAWTATACLIESINLRRNTICALVMGGFLILAGACQVWAGGAGMLALYAWQNQEGSWRFGGWVNLNAGDPQRELEELVQSGGRSLDEFKAYLRDYPQKMELFWTMLPPPRTIDQEIREDSARWGFRWTSSPTDGIGEQELEELRRALSPREAFGLTWKADPKRLVVASVNPSSRGAQSGFQSGDIVNRVERTPVISPQAFSNAVERYTPGSKLIVTVQRKRMNALSNLMLTLAWEGPPQTLREEVIEAIAKQELQGRIRDFGRYRLQEMKWLPLSTHHGKPVFRVSFDVPQAEDAMIYMEIDAYTGKVLGTGGMRGYRKKEYRDVDK